jgi:hypothetical protein
MYLNFNFDLQLFSDFKVLSSLITKLPLIPLFFEGTVCLRARQSIGKVQTVYYMFAALQDSLGSAKKARKTAWAQLWRIFSSNKIEPANRKKDQFS